MTCSPGLLRSRLNDLLTPWCAARGAPTSLQSHAASANIGVATAAMFPSVTLGGSYSFNGTTTNTWLPSTLPFAAVGGDVLRWVVESTYLIQQGDGRSLVWSHFPKTVGELS